MKSSIKIAGRLLLSAGLIALSGFIQAQVTTTQVQSISDSAVLPDNQPDSVVRIAAEAEGLVLMPTDQIPECGTFWIISDEQSPPPYPFLPSRYDLTITPVFSLGPVGQFLVDATGGAVPQPDQEEALLGISASALLQVQGNMVLDLIARIQEAQANAELNAALGQGRRQAMAMDVPSPGDGGDDTNNYYSSGFNPAYSFPTNGVWLEIINVSGGVAYLNLHNATNQVYAIWSTTNLATPFTNWQGEMEVWPTNGAVMPFTVPTLGRQNLFLRAEDWTGVHIAPPVAYDDPGESPCPHAPRDVDLSSYAGDPYSLPLTYIVVTPPTQGTLTNAGSGHFIYTPNSCYEGADSFTYKVNNGYFDSDTATVTLTTGDSVSTSSSPSTPQTCKNTPLSITLVWYDNCGEDASTFICVMLANPTNGVLTGTAPNLTYAPTNATFTGVDSFTYKVSTVCGNSATNTVTITVGDANLHPNSQTAMTGTNRPVNITLTASSSLGCTNSFNYAIAANPTHGTLTGTGTNATYTPTNNYEGPDSFTFTASDGVWTSSYPATVTIFVVAGPTNLTAQCRFDQILLNWSLDNAVQQMEPMGLSILDNRVYRSTNSGGHYLLIYTTPDYFSQTNYVDVAVATNTTYSYVVTFRYHDPYTGANYESPYSREASASPCSLPAPIRPGFDQNILAANDDNYAGGVGGQGVDLLTNLLATIGFPVKYFGTTYTNLWVNNNGNVTFDANLDTYTPESLVNAAADANPPIGGIIAPFWADVDTRAPLSGLVTYGTNTVNGHAAFGANWVDVGYFEKHDNKLNAFQLVLINRPDRASGDYDVEFNYAQIQWEEGNATGGTDGLSSSNTYPGRAGYASGSGLTFELNGSGVPHALLDTNLVTGLIRTNFNSSGVLGRYVYQFHNVTNNLAHP